MRVSAITLIVPVLLSLAAASALADWPHEVKWDQLEPESNYGFLSYISSQEQALVADDFQCAETGWITDIEFSGATYLGNDTLGSFRITLWSDVPATTLDESHPGQLLRELNLGKADPNDPLRLGWQCVVPGQYKIDIPSSEWLLQEEGTIYWIGIQGVVTDDANWFGWDFRDVNASTWGDDAVVASDLYPAWTHLAWTTGGMPTVYTGKFPTYLLKSADMCFKLTGIVPEPATGALVALGAAVLAALRRRAGRDA